MIPHWRTRLARCFGAASVITGGLVATLPSPVAAEEDGKRYELMFWTSPGNRQGTARLFDRRGQLDGPGCDLNGDVGYETETIRIAFPRRCLDDPRSLQFRSSSAHFLRDPENNVYADNPHNEHALAWHGSSKVRSG